MHLHVKAWSVTTHMGCLCHDLHAEWQEGDLDPQTTPNKGAHQIAKVVNKFFELHDCFFFLFG